MGRSALHVDRSLARAHASAAVSPVFRTIRLIHVVRGLPAGRFQSCCGMSPDLESTASFRALCAGVLACKGGGVLFIKSARLVLTALPNIYLVYRLTDNQNRPTTVAATVAILLCLIRYWRLIMLRL